MTAREIQQGLESLGLHSGMQLMIHSSLSSFGWVEGGAQTVIQALMALVGPEGTLLMPSFNHGAAFRENGPGCYDPAQTPTTNGRIPDTFWRLPGVLRSLNPTHAFAAWGKHAARYVESHHGTLTMGEDSPLGLLARDDGIQVNLGTTHRTTTAKHMVETLHRSPCLGYRTESYPVRLTDGRMVMHRTWGWRAQSCPLTDSGDLIDAEMQRRRVQKRSMVGACCVTWFTLRDLTRVIWELLERGAAEYPPCRNCPIRPRETAATVTSDWVEDAIALEAARQRLLY